MTRVVVLAVIIASAVVGAAQQTTIRIPFGPDGFDVVTFNQSRVSTKDVKHWMKFAETGYYGSYGISLSGCQESDAPRAAKEVRQAHRVVRELEEESEYPSELVPVVSYLKRLLRFRVWMGEQYLAFLQSGTAPESAYQNVDASACRAIADDIHKEPDREKACQHLGDDWTQCALKAGLQQLGDYPKLEWKVFLASYGIKEQIQAPDEGS
jgi:hypothetical protein